MSSNESGLIKFKIELPDWWIPFPRWQNGQLVKKALQAVEKVFPVNLKEKLRPLNSTKLLRFVNKKIIWTT